MDKAKVQKYKKIYREHVLPKKSVTEATPETSKSTIRIYEEFSDYRKRANQIVLGGSSCGKEK